MIYKWIKLRSNEQDFALRSDKIVAIKDSTLYGCIITTEATGYFVENSFNEVIEMLEIKFDNE